MNRNIRAAMRRGVPVLAVLAAAGMFALKAFAEPSGKIIHLFNPEKPSVSEWQDSWGDLPSGAVAKVNGNKMVVTGNLSNQSYGCVYREFEVDLDKTPYLEIDVESVASHWYLVLRGEQLPNGWVKIQPDTDQTGVLQYDLRLAIGLTGRQKFGELQFGVSVEGGAGGNKGQALVVKSMKLASATGGGSDALELYGPKNRRFSGWKNVNDDRSPSGVDIQISSDSVTLRANRGEQSYGMTYKSVNADLNKFSILKFVPETVSHHWYIIITHPELNKGFVRVQPDSNLTGTFYYDLSDITGLKGIKDFRLQVGVSTNEQKPSAFGEHLTFREISLMMPAHVPPSAKILKKKDLKFQQKIQAAVVKNLKILKEPEPVSPLSLDPRTLPAFPPAEKPAPASADFLRAIGDGYLEAFNRETGIYAAPKKPVSPPSFTETQGELVVANDFYRIAFSKENGAIKSIQAAGFSAPVIVGALEDCLWKIDTKDRALLESSAYKKNQGQTQFQHRWDSASKRLVFDYEDKNLNSHVTVTFQFDASDAVGVRAGIRNRSAKTFMSLALPHGLLFTSADLDRVIFPRLLGVAFKSGFFQARKQWADLYPSVFADYVWIGSRFGAVSVYMVQPEKQIFQPATLEFGSQQMGQQGYYTHKMPVHIDPGSEWTSPWVRLSVGRSAQHTIRDYAKDNGIDKMPSLKSRLKEGLFTRLNASPFVKVDQSVNVDIPSVLQFLDDLPRDSLLHLTTFWPGGFDKNYPDYLPPDPEYGTLQDFKTLVAKARQRGMFVMPYTNPTWWNEGPTLKKLGAEAIAVKAMDGTIITEKYNGNPGIVVSPQHPKVIERNLQTAQEFTETVPMDFLFHDQLGARRWMYQSNSSVPLSYTQGLLDLAAVISPKMPLMTEGGFDRLIPYEIGFCGMTSLSYPHFKEYDGLWGKGNWEIYPISLLLAHDKVNFYQHNLSDDVLSDTDAKLTWNLAYGFGLNVARTYIRQHLEKKWIHLADVFHKHVLVRILGEDMKGYLKLNDAVTWSRFGDVDVYANHSPQEILTVGPHTVAPEGFMARSLSGDLLAGIFTRLNGVPLEGRHYLVVKTAPEEIQLIQSDPSATFVTLARPSGWSSDAGIRAFRLEKGREIEIPCAVQPRTLTLFLRDSREETDAYRIRYSAKPENVELSMRVSQTGLEQPGNIAIEVTAKNRGSQTLSEVRASCRIWKIDSHSGVPSLSAAPSPEKGRKESAPADSGSVFSDLKPEQAGTARFAFAVPPSYFMDGRYVWVRAQIEVGQGKQAAVRTVDQKIDLVR